MDKHALVELGKKAAREHIADNKPLQGSVDKIAKEHTLNANQYERLCQFANHAVNAHLMKKTAYTEFELAKPIMKAEEKTASFFALIEDDSFDKIASDEEYQEDPHLLLNKIASEYNLSPYGLRGVTVDGLLENILNMSLERAEVELVKAAGLEEEAYQHLRQDLLSGVSPRDAVLSLQKAGYVHDVHSALDRLEAEGLLGASERDDQGPYSLDRHYKTASVELSEDSVYKRINESFMDCQKEYQYRVKVAEWALSELTKESGIISSASGRMKSFAKNMATKIPKVVTGAKTKSSAALGTLQNNVSKPKKVATGIVGKLKDNKLFAASAALGGVGMVGEGFRRAKARLNENRAVG